MRTPAGPSALMVLQTRLFGNSLVRRPHGLLGCCTARPACSTSYPGPPGQPLLMMGRKVARLFLHTSLHLLSPFRLSCSVPFFSLRIPHCQALKATHYYHHQHQQQTQLIADLDIQLSNHHLILIEPLAVSSSHQSSSSFLELRTSTIHSLSSLVAALHLRPHAPYRFSWRASQLL